MNNAMNPAEPADVLLQKLATLVVLEDDEKQAIRALPLTIRIFETRRDIVREGEVISECCVILDGFACRYMLLPNGRRQILSFDTRGDLPDLQGLHLKTMDHSVGTLSPVRAAFVSHRALSEIALRHPRITGAFWRNTLTDAAIFRVWIVGIGRRPALTRVAHLLCELRMRLDWVGLGRDGVYDLPITQTDLADALGLSTVHVNRVLQDLRRPNLILLHGSNLTIRDWPALQAVGEFSPIYLHLEQES